MGFEELHEAGQGENAFRFIAVNAGKEPKADGVAAALGPRYT
jgi:hypothetical protein